VTAFFTPAPPRVLAHRGLATAAPENTLAAFRAAVAAGATHIETDVHASSDGVAIVSHDAVLDRVAGRPGRVADLTAAELAEVDLGGGEGYPTLAQALAEFPDVRFNIDIKEAAVAAPAVAAIVAADAIDRVLVASFDDARRLAAVRELPGVATSVGRAGALPAIIGARLGWTGLVRRVLRDVQAVQFPVSQSGLRVITRRSVATFRAVGVEVHVWTVNDPAEMTRLLDLGVDGLITDRADLALPLVSARR